MEWIYNDGGRIAAGFQGHHAQKRPAGDCVLRSIAIACDFDYNMVRLTANNIVSYYGFRGAFSASIGYPRFVYDHILKQAGWRYFTLFKSKYSKVKHLADTELFPDGSYIIKCPKHLSCVVDGDLHDIVDCRDWRAYGYWRQDRPTDPQIIKEMRHGKL